LNDGAGNEDAEEALHREGYHRSDSSDSETDSDDDNEEQPSAAAAAAEFTTASAVVPEGAETADGAEKVEGEQSQKSAQIPLIRKVSSDQKKVS